jgi:hypothetical protein
MNSTASSISIRSARQDDYVELWRVASLDSALVPEEPLIVAESGGEVVAALSRTSGESIADPFRPTAELVELLRLRAGQMTSESERPRRRLLARLRGRPVPVPAQ